MAHQRLTTTSEVEAATPHLPGCRLPVPRLLGHGVLPKLVAACRGRWKPGWSPITSGPAGTNWTPRRAGNCTARLADGCRTCTPSAGSPALAPGRPGGPTTLAGHVLP